MYVLSLNESTNFVIKNFHNLDSISTICKHHAKLYVWGEKIRKQKSK